VPDGTTSHSTKRGKTCAKSLVISANLQKVNVISQPSFMANQEQLKQQKPLKVTFVIYAF
jgi:hypothetical protein